MEVLGIKSVEDSSDKKYFPDGVENMESKEKLQVLKLAIDLVINKFVYISYGEHEKLNAAGKKHLQAYAYSLLNLGLLYTEVNDGIREGDGYRILCYWHYFLLHFKVSNRKNYSLEAFNFLAQYCFLLSPRMAMQLLWNCTINVHGYRGRNVPCDLHMEHLNLEAKNSITGLGSNITDESVIRFGCISVILLRFSTILTRSTR